MHFAKQSAESENTDVERQEFFLRVLFVCVDCCFMLAEDRDCLAVLFEWVTLEQGTKRKKENPLTDSAELLMRNKTAMLRHDTGNIFS